MNLLKSLLAASIILIGCRETEVSGSAKLPLGQQNAIWTESIFLRGHKPSTGEKLTEEHLKIYAETLQRNKVKYAYLFAGPYGKNGRLPKYSFSETAQKSVLKLKSYYPEIIILPWLGGVQNKTVYLGDSTWVNNALHDTKKLIQTLGVQGVHIDFEYILKGNDYLDTTIEAEGEFDEMNYGDHVNSFHKKLKELVPQAFISSVVVATAPDTKPWKRKTSMGELLTLSKYVDQISFLYYDTSINSQNTFQRNCIEQIEDIAVLKRAHPDVQCLLSIGTFVNRPELRKYRNLIIENIPNSLTTIKKGVEAVGSSKQLVDGISIFCDWETDQKEWSEFYTNWVDESHRRP